MFENYILDPGLATLEFWHYGFGLTYFYGTVADDWSMYCMGGEL